MIGYKAFNEDLTCRGFQYEIGKTYTYDGEIAVCRSGFHFCKTLANCYQFYPISENIRICKIEALGEVLTNDNVKYVTNKIKILSEVEKPWIAGNTSENSSGYCNNGDFNSGDYNTGNFNSGNCNSGDFNTGDFNSGNCNSGMCNSGSCNSGNFNTGNSNSGDFNSGDFNKGDYNTGDFNSGVRSNGVFNSNIKPTINMFNKATEWTYDDWGRSQAFEIMKTCPLIKEYRQKWWDELLDLDKQCIYDLPNFDADVFEQCTEIKVR